MDQVQSTKEKNVPVSLDTHRKLKRAAVDEEVPMKRLVDRLLLEGLEKRAGPGKAL